MRRIAAFIIIGIAAQYATASAQEALPSSLQTFVGRAEVFRSETPIANIVIGNPAVLDANALGNRTITVSAKAEGFTSLIVLDENNDVISNTAIVILPERYIGRRAVAVREGKEQTIYMCQGNRDCVRMEADQQANTPVARSASDAPDVDAGPSPDAEADPTS